jgi:hypothetical protein
MDTMNPSKINDALDLIERCKGVKGVWASTGRYNNQCWTRDFCLTVCPLLLQTDSQSDLDLVGTHLFEITKRQKDNGKVPILYLDNEKKFLKDKIQRLVEQKTMSFMLTRYLDDELENLTPHTRDSEVLFIIAVDQFVKKCNDVIKCTILMNSTRKTLANKCTILMNSARKALAYVETILKDDLIQGADWRDTREDLDDKQVLTNQCYLYKAYKILGFDVKAMKIMQILNRDYWNGSYFKDFPGSDRFDILGNSLTVLNEIASKDQMDLIFEYAMNNLSTPHGFKMTETFLPALDQKEKEVMDRDGAVIWPFIGGFLLSGMITRGGGRWISVAEKEFEKWEKLQGFFEWYDIVDGNGYGSQDQIWSAALYLRVRQNLIDHPDHDHLQK